ncbi:hypothetical protein [Kitasatospora sp. NPDC059827]|uniref:hypothetical protein n=1 Tax=Kitasatospora sp. NPDC059827 TaxID=3346964 RepID=UPI003658DA61
MIELVFSVRDVARARFSSSPMDHLLLGAVGAARGHYVGASSTRERWWRRVRAQAPAKAAPFIDLVNASSEGMPDFLGADVLGHCRRLSDELDGITAVRDDVVRSDLAMYEQVPRVPRIVEELRDEGSAALRRVADAAWALHRACLAPDWPDMERALQTDIQRRARTMAEQGPGVMLGTLHPQLAWHDRGVLEYTEPAGFDGVWSVPLEGRGLELRPSLFLQEGVGFLLQDGRQPTVFHPVTPGSHRDGPPDPRDGLAVLLGPAKARVLRAVGPGKGTTELARCLGIKPPTASAHAAALRAAGLVATTRQGRTVRHTLTPLGADLLDANPG